MITPLCMLLYASVTQPRRISLNCKGFESCACANKREEQFAYGNTLRYANILPLVTFVFITTNTYLREYLDLRERK